eukprot:TRINITY_DN9971_c4_g1_i1.p1 TRINITY_DN9971_c4_g1~~TRINITY_DN9971_c4_g1_i1.p1  ORF type:complete len:305 (+),score=64.14 TRINITY_DN9971_c4_g1_i1:60-974(+)
MSGPSRTVNGWYAAQVKRMSPGEAEERRNMMKRRQEAVEMKCKAKKMRTRAAKTSAGMKGALQQMQQTPSGGGFGGYASVVNDVQRCWGAAEAYDEKEKVESDYALCKEGESEDAAVEREEGEEGRKSFEKLLSDLLVEPSNDAEVAAKFQLYEAYLATVEKLRKDLFEFWEECKHVIPDGPVKTGIVKQQIAIDDTQNTGLPDFDPRRWFVYDMTRKAQQNNSMLSQLLRSIEVKLSLINDTEDQDCPFCLEMLDDSHPSQVLSCCHRVGVECWKAWVATRGSSVTCPVCRNSEFLTYLEDNQ